MREVSLKAFVLIQKQSGREPVGAALRGIPGVESANDLTGAYDAIALANAESVGDLFETVLPRIRGLPGVTHALPAPLVWSLSAVLPKEEAAA